MNFEKLIYTEVLPGVVGLIKKQECEDFDLSNSAELH